MSELYNLHSLLGHALEWLELEFKRYQLLEKHWKSLKGKVEEVLLIERTNVLKRDLKYVGSAERRFSKYEQNLRPEMLAFIREIPEVNVELGGVHYATIDVIFSKIKQELDRIDIEAANLLVDSSLHSSKLNDCWEHINDALKTHDIHRIEGAIVEMGTIIEEGKKWIRALVTDLSTIKKEDLPKIENELEFKNMVKEKLPVLAEFEAVWEHFKKADTLLEGSILLKANEEVLEKWGVASHRNTTIPTPDLGHLKLKQKADFDRFIEHLKAARKILEKTPEGCRKITEWLNSKYIGSSFKTEHKKELTFLTSCQSIIKDVFDLITYFIDSIKVDRDANLVFSTEGRDKLRNTSISLLTDRHGIVYPRGLGHFWEEYHYYRKRADGSLELQALYFIFGETSKMLRYSYPLFHQFERDFL